MYDPAAYHETMLVIPIAGYPLAHIRAGSGVVGRVRAQGDLLAYFEGNLLGASNMVTWADRAYHAMGRMISDYPTSAMLVAPAGEFVRIGQWDEIEGRAILDGPDAERRLAVWLGAEALDPAELLASSPTFENRRMLRAMRANGRGEQAQIYARTIGVELDPL